MAAIATSPHSASSQSASPKSASSQSASSTKEETSNQMFEVWLNRQYNTGNCADCNKYGCLILVDACPAELDEYEAMNFPEGQHCCEKYICEDYNCKFTCKGCKMPVEKYTRDAYFPGYINPLTCPACNTKDCIHMYWTSCSPDKKRELLRKRGW